MKTCTMIRPRLNLIYRYLITGTSYTKWERAYWCWGHRNESVFVSSFRDLEALNRQVLICCLKVGCYEQPPWLKQYTYFIAKCTNNILKAYSVGGSWLLNNNKKNCRKFSSSLVLKRHPCCIHFFCEDMKIEHLVIFCYSILYLATDRVNNVMKSCQ